MKALTANLIQEISKIAESASVVDRKQRTTRKGDSRFAWQAIEHAGAPRSVDEVPRLMPILRDVDDPIVRTCIAVG